MNINSKCPVCGKEVVMGTEFVERVCDKCGDKFISSRYCENGHAVCNRCSTKDYFYELYNYAKSTKLKNPIDIAAQLMSRPDSALVGCRHSITAYAAVLTAFYKCGGKIKKIDELKQSISTGLAICPTEMCLLGTFCLIPISMGIAFQSAIGNMDADTARRISNDLTNYCVNNISSPNNKGNKDCCIRNMYLTIIFASKFISRNLWIDIPLPPKVKCAYHVGNPRCNKEQCPLFNGLSTDKDGVTI